MKYLIDCFPNYHLSMAAVTIEKMSYSRPMSKPCRVVSLGRRLLDMVCTGNIIRSVTVCETGRGVEAHSVHGHG